MTVISYRNKNFPREKSIFRAVFVIDKKSSHNVNKLVKTVCPASLTVTSPRVRVLTPQLSIGGTVAHGCHAEHEIAVSSFKYSKYLNVVCLVDNHHYFRYIY